MYNIYSGIERPTNYKRYDTINNILLIINYPTMDDYEHVIHQIYSSKVHNIKATYILRKQIKI